MIKLREEHKTCYEVTSKLQTELRAIQYQTIVFSKKIFLEEQKVINKLTGYK